MSNALCTICHRIFRHSYELEYHTAQSHVALKSLDGLFVTTGAAVWDYNLDLVVVDLTTAKFAGADRKPASVWFDTNDPRTGVRASYMNCERVWARHPNTGQWAAAALLSAQYEMAEQASRIIEAGLTDLELDRYLAPEVPWDEWYTKAGINRLDAGRTEADTDRTEQALSITDDMIRECKVPWESFDRTDLADMRACMQSLTEIVLAQQAALEALGEGF